MFKKLTAHDRCSYQVPNEPLGSCFGNLEFVLLHINFVHFHFHESRLIIIRKKFRIKK